MVRIPRRTHSVSGPPSVDCIFSDVACCCNFVKIQQFYMSMMALRRNPYRMCKIEGVKEMPLVCQEKQKRRRSCTVEIPAMQPPTKAQRVTKQTPRPLPLRAPRTGPFAFVDLPREVRDHVLSYLVVRRGRQTPILEAKVILRDQKKRATILRNREKTNAKRAQTGRQPVAHRDAPTDPIVHLDAMRASRSLYYEASACFYQRNYFAISLDSLPATTFDIPPGWDCTRIKKLQLELQLKDSPRMNSYIDWASFFAKFPALVHLRIIPTFHQRYYEWARTELESWKEAPFVFRAFFRELLAEMPGRLVWKLGIAAAEGESMQIEGKTHVSQGLLWDMYVELGPRTGHRRGVSHVLDCPSD